MRKFRYEIIKELDEKGILKKVPREFFAGDVEEIEEFISLIVTKTAKKILNELMGLRIYINDYRKLCKKWEAEE